MVMFLKILFICFLTTLTVSKLQNKDEMRKLAVPSSFLNKQNLDSPAALH